tara:strand:- start:405 stop:656 length:252 start_codon:yes stop_codon:yes gene_type:complete
MVQLSENEKLEIATEKALERIQDILFDETCSDADKVVMVGINALRFMYRTEYATAGWPNIWGWLGGLISSFTEEAMRDARERD